MTATTTTRTYAIDPTHSSVHFSIRHLMISKVRGSFDTLSGTITLGESSIPTALDVTIAATSINTRDAQRDGHLRSPDFFDVEKFPNITFTSSSIAATGDGEFSVTGSLTMHGVARDITFKASVSGEGKDPWGNHRIAFEGTAKLNRKDYGLVWNQALEAGGVAVGEDVDITLDIESVPAA